MFPPSLPHYFINKFSSDGQIVLDPFSGRGTTVLEACFMNRIGVGNDKNPLAYLLTKSKSNVPHKGRIISKIQKLESKFDPAKINLSKEEEKIRIIFNDFTLKQLIFLKQKLNWKTSNVDAFISAMVLGIMHGNSKGYLSVSMPNTFSMSPNYIKNYIKKHGLEKPKRDVFFILRKKLSRCYQKPNQKGKAYNLDVRNMTKIQDSSVKLIVTSPPYTRVIRYGEFNWIRLWFFNKQGKEVDKNLFFTQSMEKYCKFMIDSLKEIYRVLEPNSKAVLVIGDVKDRTSDKIFNLASEVWDKCAKPLGFKLAQPMIEDIISSDTKVSKIWGDKKGNATKIDRILIIEKSAKPRILT